MGVIKKKAKGMNSSMNIFRDDSLPSNGCKANETGNLCAISNEY